MRINVPVVSLAEAEGLDDDTVEAPMSLPAVPLERFAYDTLPVGNIASLIGRVIFFCTQGTVDMVPSWIGGKIVGGRPNKRGILLGITMIIKLFDLERKKNIPRHLLKEELAVSFTGENYGKRWVLLKEI